MREHAGSGPGVVTDPFAVPPLVPAVSETPGTAAAVDSGVRVAAPDSAGAGAVVGAAGVAEPEPTLPAASDDGGWRGAGASEPGEEAPETAAAEGEGTAAALLAAGRKLFAEHGYAGASVRAITAAANANLGAITYHFGSKKAFYNRVVEACVSPLVARVEAALSGRGPVLDRLENVVRAYFDHFAENPELPHLMLQEVVLAGAPPEAAAPFMRRIYALIVAAIREGQGTGELRPGDPTLMGMSLIGQPIFPMLVRQPVEAITGLDLTDARTRERVVAHVAAFARAGFAGPTATSAGARASEAGATAMTDSTPAASTRRVSGDASGSAEAAP